MKNKHSSDDLGDLIWVRYPVFEHAARPILNRPATSEGMIWIRWEVNGMDEQVPREYVRVLSGRSSRRRHQNQNHHHHLLAENDHDDKTLSESTKQLPHHHEQESAMQKSTSSSLQSPPEHIATNDTVVSRTTIPRKHRRKHPQPQQWPHSPLSEAVVQFRDITVGDYVYRDQEVYCVTGIVCFSPHKYNRFCSDFVQLMHIKTQEVVYELKEWIQPGAP